VINTKVAAAGFAPANRNGKYQLDSNEVLKMKRLFITFVIALMVMVIIVGGCTNQAPVNEPQS
jgi:hypothetical protein